MFATLAEFPWRSSARQEFRRLHAIPSAHFNEFYLFSPPRVLGMFSRRLKIARKRRILPIQTAMKFI